jgi:hypothetical protein
MPPCYFGSILVILFPLDPDSRHQPLLSEDERVDIVFRGCRSDVFGLSLVEHDDGGTDADLEAIGLSSSCSAFAFMKNIA